MPATDPYHRIAGVYDRLVSPLLSGVRRVGLEVLPPQAGWQVLDVGCGTGVGLEPYARAGCRLAGVDVSPAMLAQASVRLGDNAELHLTDGDVLPFDDRRFDLVMATMLLHEVPASGRRRSLAEMARVVRPGGRLLIIDFRFGSWRGWRGPTIRTLGWAVERVGGHYSGYRSFKRSGGVPGVVGELELAVEREKIVAGGNLAVYVIAAGG